MITKYSRLLLYSCLMRKSDWIGNCKPNQLSWKGNPPSWCWALQYSTNSEIHKQWVTLGSVRECIPYSKSFMIKDGVQKSVALCFSICQLSTFVSLSTCQRIQWNFVRNCLWRIGWSLRYEWLGDAQCTPKEVGVWTILEVWQYNQTMSYACAGNCVMKQWHRIRLKSGFRFCTYNHDTVPVDRVLQLQVFKHTVVLDSAIGFWACYLYWLWIVLEVKQSSTAAKWIFVLNSKSIHECRC